MQLLYCIIPYCCTLKYFCICNNIPVESICCNYLCYQHIRIWWIIPATNLLSPPFCSTYNILMLWFLDQDKHSKINNTNHINFIKFIFLLNKDKGGIIVFGFILLLTFAYAYRYNNLQNIQWISYLIYFLTMEFTMMELSLDFSNKTLTTHTFV